MNDQQRAQIALILQRATKFACATLDERIRSIYADHSAKGLLHSGATVKVALNAMDGILVTLIPEMAQRVAEVVISRAAFDELNISLQTVFDVYHERLADILRVANGRPTGEGADRQVISAAETLFGNWRSDLEAQVAILAYDFEPATAALDAPPLLQGATPKQKGGRPRHDFWDDVWAAIAASLYDGGLIPKSQADVERAMADWIEEHGHSASDSSVRARARRLWDRISATDQ